MSVRVMSPMCLPEANTTPIKVPDELGGGWGPCEGRPPGPVWAHQHFDKFPPSIWVEATQAPAKTNITYDPRVLSTLNSGIDPSAPIPVQFHPSMPIQLPTSVWTFNGTIPPKLVQGRYGEPLLFRFQITEPPQWGLTMTVSSRSARNARSSVAAVCASRTLTGGRGVRVRVEIASSVRDADAGHFGS